MNVSRTVFMATLLLSTSAMAKTFKFKNSQTGQTMEVFCWNPNSISCKHKIEEVKERLKHSTNPGAKTLSGARAQDTGKKIKNDTLSIGSSVKESAVSAGSFVGTKAVEAGSFIKDKAVDTGSFIKDKSVAAGEAISGTGQKAGTFLRDGAFDTGYAVRDGFQKTSDVVGKGYDHVVGKSYRVKVPGIEHTMTFHCRGGLESEECKNEQKETVAAIKAGSKAETLSKHRGGLIEDTKEVVADTASSIKNGTLNTFDKMGHNYCRDKVARHARDFASDYEKSGTALVSYEEKLQYIEKKLIEEGKREDCAEHFDQAVLGYQLKWVARGEVKQEKTHIFDGLGRLADGGYGYWKNEERGDYQSSARGF